LQHVIGFHAPSPDCCRENHPAGDELSRLLSVISAFWAEKFKFFSTNRRRGGKMLGAHTDNLSFQ